MRLRITNTHTYFSVNTLTTSKLKKLDLILSYMVQGAYFSAAFKRHGWDGRARLLSKVYKNRQLVAYRFPTGLLSKTKEIFGDFAVYEHASGAGGRGIKADKDSLSGLLEGITLYSFQCRAVQKMLKHKRGVCQLPTGSGKTEIAAATIKYLDLQTVVMVPTLDLLYQTRSRYAKRLGVPLESIGLIGEGEYSPQKITVASVPTLRNMVEVRRGGKIVYADERAQDFFKQARVVISDEAHMVGNNTFYEVFMSFTGADYRYGMSATPFDRSDGNTIMLIGATGPCIARMKSSALMKHGYLATPEITVYRISGPRISGAISWQKAYSEGIVQNPIRNSLIIDTVKKHKGQKIIVLFSRIAHGNLLSRLLEEEGIHHKMLSGKDAGEIRESARKAFEEEGLDVILASMIFKLGVDLPAIKVLIRADGSKSTISTIQILGRALRIKDGDNKVFVYDFFDDYQKYLKRHSKQRLKDYLSIGPPVFVKQIDVDSGQEFLSL